MTISEQSNDITELQPEDTKAVVGGASAIEYGLLAATVSQEIIKVAPTLTKLTAAPAFNKPTK
jgi:hypothetical protein